MTNKSKMKKAIKKEGISVRELAKLIGIDTSTFYRKMNGKGIGFTIAEAKKIAERLHLGYDDVNEIFFAEIVA